MRCSEPHRAVADVLLPGDLSCKSCCPCALLRKHVSGAPVHPSKTGFEEAQQSPITHTPCPGPEEAYHTGSYGPNTSAQPRTMEPVPGLLLMPKT